MPPTGDTPEPGLGEPTSAAAERQTDDPEPPHGDPLAGKVGESESESEPNGTSGDQPGGAGDVEPPHGDPLAGKVAEPESEPESEPAPGDDASDGETLAERRRRAAAEATTRRQGGWGRAAKRYGPFVAVVVIVAAVIAVYGVADSGDGGDGREAQPITVPDRETLVRSGPMTPERAELEGRQDVDFGPHCDPETGRLKLPTIYAAPCVEPFTGDNGGATSRGVTEDEVLIVRYTANPDLANEQSVSALLNTGAQFDPETMAEALDNYTRLYNEVYETYGRTVRVVEYIGTGAGNDRQRARADAIAIAEMEPFAVVGGPWEAGNAFATELARRGVICGPACALAQPDSLVDRYHPHIWLPGPTLRQGAAMLAEMVSKLAGPGPAEMAGDEALQAQERRYAMLHYDTPAHDFTESFEVTRDALEEAGIRLDAHHEFELDLAAAQEDARTIISQLKAEGITTVIYTGDPLTPSALTREATVQEYHPEWILGPSVFGEYTLLARSLDSEQWSHGFGLSWGAARGPVGSSDGATIYEWAFGEEVPNSTAALSEATLRWAFQGIHLAGPNLTPETFRDAYFRYPATGGGPTTPLVSWGDHGFWPQPDLGAGDDLTLIWWDPDARGVDEIGQEGRGMYRYARGGARYGPGEIPDSPEAAGLFDVESSVTMYEERPPEDLPPDYPPPDLASSG